MHIGYASALACLLGGCASSTLASFVPTLELRVVARTGAASLSPRTRGPWDTSLVAWLRFEPRIAAQAVPVRAELTPGLELTPCEPEDVSCLEESAELEQELSHLAGELE